MEELMQTHPKISWMETILYFWSDRELLLKLVEICQQIISCIENGFVNSSV